MEFECYLCNKVFSDTSDIIKHLKKIHFIKENINEIRCLFPKCEKNFDTFNALRQHIKKCSDLAKQKTTKKKAVKEVNKYNISFNYNTLIFYYF